MANQELSEEVRIFLLEAYEIVDMLESELVRLEKAPTDLGIINKIFRGLHTIKGNSGFLALTRLERLCHTTESVLDRMRNGSVSASPALITLLLNAVDHVREHLGSLERSGCESSAEHQTDQQLASFLK